MLGDFYKPSDAGICVYVRALLPKKSWLTSKALLQAKLLAYFLWFIEKP